MFYSILNNVISCTLYILHILKFRRFHIFLFGRNYYTEIKAVILYFVYVDILFLYELDSIDIV